MRSLLREINCVQLNSKLTSNLRNFLIRLSVIVKLCGVLDPQVLRFSMLLIIIIIGYSRTKFILLWGDRMSLNPPPLSLYTHIYIYIHVCICIYIHIYIYVYVHKSKLHLKYFRCKARSSVTEKRCIQIFLKPGTRWRWVRSFKPQSPNCWENNLLYTLNRRPQGPRYGLHALDNVKTFVLPGIKLQFFGLPDLIQVSIPTTLS